MLANLKNNLKISSCKYIENNYQDNSTPLSSNNHSSVKYSRPAKKLEKTFKEIVDR